MNQSRGFYPESDPASAAFAAPQEKKYTTTIQLSSDGHTGNERY